VRGYVESGQECWQGVLGRNTWWFTVAETPARSAAQLYILLLVVIIEKSQLCHHLPALCNGHIKVLSIA
jgi:hypothetical protein